MTQAITGTRRVVLRHFCRSARCHALVRRLGVCLRLQPVLFIWKRSYHGFLTSKYHRTKLYKTGSLHKLRGMSILITVLALVQLAAFIGVHGDAPRPVLEIGDQWRYSIRSAFQSFSLDGTMTLTIEAEEPVALQSGTFDSFRLKLSASGTVSGSVTGTWTTDGTLSVRTSDLATLKTHFTQVIVIGVTITQTIDITAHSPTAGYDFPLSVGKVWTQTTTTTTNTTQVFSTGQRDTRVTTNTTTTTYSIARTETLTLTAGAFETYVISHTDSTGSTGTDYYSAQVGNSAKSTAFDASSGSTTNIDLIEVKAWPYSANINVSSGGQTYNVLVRTNVAASSLTQNSTAIAFQVSGSNGLTGSGRVSIPKELNNTRVRVYVDSTLVSASASGDANNYYVSFSFTLSTHTITVLFLEQQGLFNSPYFWGGIAAVIIAIVTATLLLLKRRSRAPEAAPAAPEEKMPPATPPPTAPPPTPAPPAETPVPQVPAQ